MNLNFITNRYKINIENFRYLTKFGSITFTDIIIYNIKCECDQLKLRIDKMHGASQDTQPQIV